MSAVTAFTECSSGDRRGDGSSSHGEDERFTFTFTAFSRCFYPKRLIISKCVIRSATKLETLPFRSIYGKHFWKNHLWIS